MNWLKIEYVVFEKLCNLVLQSQSKDPVPISDFMLKPLASSSSSMTSFKSLNVVKKVNCIAMYCEKLLGLAELWEGLEPSTILVAERFSECRCQVWSKKWVPLR